MKGFGQCLNCGKWRKTNTGKKKVNESLIKTIKKYQNEKKQIQVKKGKWKFDKDNKTKYQYKLHLVDTSNSNGSSL